MQARMAPALHAAVVTMSPPERQLLAVLRGAPAGLSEVAMLERLRSFGRPPSEAPLVLGLVLASLRRKLRGSGLALYGQGAYWLVAPELRPSSGRQPRVDPEPTLAPWRATT